MEINEIINSIQTSNQNIINLLKDLKNSLAIEKIQKENSNINLKLYAGKYFMFEKNWLMKFVKPEEVFLTHYMREYIMFKFLKPNLSYLAFSKGQRPTNYEMQKIKQIHVLEITEIKKEN